MHRIPAATVCPGRCSRCRRGGTSRTHAVATGVLTAQVTTASPSLSKATAAGRRSCSAPKGACGAPNWPPARAKAPRPRWDCRVVHIGVDRPHRNRVVPAVGGDLRLECAGGQRARTRAAGSVSCRSAAGSELHDGEVRELVARPQSEYVAALVHRDTSGSNESSPWLRQASGHRRTCRPSGGMHPAHAGRLRPSSIVHTTPALSSTATRGSYASSPGRRDHLGNAEAAALRAERRLDARVEPSCRVHARSALSCSSNATCGSTRSRTRSRCSPRRRSWPPSGRSADWMKLGSLLLAESRRPIHTAITLLRQSNATRGDKASRPAGETCAGADQSPVRGLKAEWTAVASARRSTRRASCRARRRPPAAGILARGPEIVCGAPKLPSFDRNDASTLRLPSLAPRVHTTAALSSMSTCGSK